jgi:hypothetical protein
MAGAGKQQAQVIVDLGDGADGGAGIARGGLLFAGERPSIESTSGFSICSRNWRAYADNDST